MSVTMLTLWFWLRAGVSRARQVWHTRWQTVAGVEVTGETIGWLIAAIILVILGVAFAIGPGTKWVNGILDTVTQISTSST